MVSLVPYAINACNHLDYEYTIEISTVVKLKAEHSGLRILEMKANHIVCHTFHNVLKQAITPPSLSLLPFHTYIIDQNGLKTISYFFVMSQRLLLRSSNWRLGAVVNVRQTGKYLSKTSS